MESDTLFGPLRHTAAPGRGEPSTPRLTARRDCG